MLVVKKHRELDELQRVRGTAGVTSPVDVARSAPDFCSQRCDVEPFI